MVTQFSSMHANAVILISYVIIHVPPRSNSVKLASKSIHPARWGLGLRPARALRAAAVLLGDGVDLSLHHLPGPHHNPIVMAMERCVPLTRFRSSDGKCPLPALLGQEYKIPHTPVLLSHETQFDIC